MATSGSRVRNDGSKDLYACGAGVYVPSLSVDEKTRRNGLVNARKGVRVRRRHTIATGGGEGGGRRVLREHVGQLQHSLAFTEDVVSSRTPHSLTYSQARGRLADVFLPSLVVPTTSRSKKHEKLITGGPYETKRHLCFLSGPPNLSTTAQNQPYPKKASSIKSFTFDHATSTVTPGSTVPSYPSGMLYRRMRTVPASQSIDWKERALIQVSSSTAFKLAGHRRKQELQKYKKDDALTMGEFKSHGNEIIEKETGKMEEKYQRKENYTHYLDRGAKPIWRKGREDLIVLDNNTTFTKVLIKNYPLSHSEWCEQEEEEEEKQGDGIVKGGRRWRALPLPAPTPEHMKWRLGRFKSDCDVIGESPLSRDKSSMTIVRSNQVQQQTFCQILKEWSRCRAIHIQPKESTETAILNNLGSLNNSTRIRGTVACSSLTQQHLKNSSLANSLSENEEIAKALESILSDDEARCVHISAAIALNCIGRSTELAVDTLLRVIERRETDGIDEWAGLQTLVEVGMCEDIVVKKLQNFLLNSSESWRRDKAGALMARLSDKMPLVHALLAEQLTSRGWQERHSACDIIPLLLCPLSSDVCNRLVVISWEDWSSSVRIAASKALGKTGHGHLLHDELVRRLSKGDEIERLDALKKINSLELMTPQLLSAFLPSLSDQHASIRVEAIAICGKLAAIDEGVLRRLLQLLGDPIWIIRAHTLKALRSIGYKGRDVIEQLLWSVGCDKVPAVRAEACSTLSQLLKKESKEEEEKEERGGEESLRTRAISTLQERLIVEDDSMVTEQLELRLREMGASAKREDPMTDFISSEVKRLGTCQAIIEEVSERERQTLTNYIINRPVTHLTTRDYLTPQQRQKFYSHKNLLEQGVWPDEKRAWSPDHQTIEENLRTIRQLTLASSVSPSQ